jgi:hypothetical protein
MTHSVAAIANAASTAETQRSSAARTTGSSFARVQAAAVKTAEAKDSSTSTDDTKTTSSKTAPQGERTQKVEGHNYVEIVSGPRNGMFINNTGSKRDGEAFLIVKRHGREFHVYGTGDDRKVYEVGRKREDSDSSGSQTTSGTQTTSGSDTTAASGTTGSSTTAGAGTSAT